MWHTAKFVEFAPNNCPPKTICILPKSLTIMPPPLWPLPLHPAPTRQPGNASHFLPPTMIMHRHREKENKTTLQYDNLTEKAKFPVANGFVSFTRMFCYLCSLINYSLRNYIDITAKIASATTAMGALKIIWHNPHLNIYNKYLLFWAIPMNLLLWGAETWPLRKSQLDQLEVFLHRSIHWILQISMSKVQEDIIWNEKVCEMFYSIPCRSKHDCSPPSRHHW